MRRPSTVSGTLTKRPWSRMQTADRVQANRVTHRRRRDLPTITSQAPLPLSDNAILIELYPTRRGYATLFSGLDHHRCRRGTTTPSSLPWDRCGRVWTPETLRDP